MVKWFFLTFVSQQLASQKMQGTAVDSESTSKPRGMVSVIIKGNNSQMVVV